MDLTSQMVKNAAKELGADLCGVASMDRFEGAPKQQDPRYIFPDAEACIVLGFRLPRGLFRGIEEGTYFAAYASMGYGGLNLIYMPIVLRGLVCCIEDHEWEAVPIPNNYPGATISFATQRHHPERSRPVREGLPRPDVMMDYRIAAFCAGLGEFGYSKVFLNPEFGPCVRYVAILTDAPLEPDPLFEGKLCDRCMQCARECSGQAISETETESITVAGRRIEWGKLDTQKCSVAYRGGTPEYNPFMRKSADPAAYEDLYCGGGELQKVCGYSTVHHHNPALEGARGCVRACMDHLHKRKALSRSFVNPFRKRPPWKLAPPALDPDWDDQPGPGIPVNDA